MTAANLRTAIDDYRHVRGITQRELAKEIGISAMILHRFLHKKEVEGRTIIMILLWLLK